MCAYPTSHGELAWSKWYGAHIASSLLALSINSRGRTCLSENLAELQGMPKSGRANEFCQLPLGPSWIFLSKFTPVALDSWATHKVERGGNLIVPYTFIWKASLTRRIRGQIDFLTTLISLLHIRGCLRFLLSPIITSCVGDFSLCFVSFIVWVCFVACCLMVVE